MTVTLPLKRVEAAPVLSRSGCELRLLESLFGHAFQEWGWAEARSARAAAGAHADPSLASILSDVPVDRPAVVSDLATRQKYILIPLQRGDRDAAAAVGVAPADRRADLCRLAAAASLILKQEREHLQLESERDALADRIGEDFEELHWLRGLATILSSSDAADELETVANEVLPQLQALLRAEAIVLARLEADDDSGHVPRTTSTPQRHVVRAGRCAVDDAQCTDLMRQFASFPSGSPVVFNRDSGVHPLRLQTSARNVAAVPINHGQQQYGWLIALNRLGAPADGDEAPSADQVAAEFGSYEVGLMTTAAGMLAGHARNVELFRSEESLRLSVIETITGALDARDPYTCGHSRRVGRLAADVGQRMGFSAEQCEQIYVTGLLHDVGKIGIPDEVLRKPDRLSDEEFEIIKQHPTIGHSILSPLKRLSFVLPGVLHHHERIDGRGYPQGLAADEIPFDARILAVADSYDAMTSNRAYRDGMPAARALEILQQESGRQWDASVVEAFLSGQMEAADDSRAGTR